ncbi:MAG TPA: secretin N-terminal domain-containing protein [Tepidisphaeraceae bacterium]|nr:secretin N-terminal domain-containing protein [Tepidisphaeraceae bacterium]
MAATSVYSDRAIAAKPARPGDSQDKSTTDVKVLDEADPFASSPTTSPATTEVKSPAAPVQLNPDGTFSLNITAGADIVEQLRVIGFQAQTSIIPSKEVHGALPAMDLYNVTVHEALDALLQTNGLKWVEKGKFIYVYSAKEVAQMEKDARVTHTEVFHLFYTPAADAEVMIKPVLSKEAGEVALSPAAKVGIPTGASEAGGNSHANDDVLVVTDYPENLDKVRQILKEIDRRPQQILIEATILSASLSENNALGVDFNIVGGVDFSSITHTSGQITNANLPTGSTAFAAGDTHSTVGTGNSFSSGIPNGFKVGVVMDNISVFLSALEGVTDTTVLANPKVLALNKQKGEVVVGKQIGYLTTTTTETTSTQSVQFLDTGTRLVFRPFVGDDGYIRMEVHPEDSDGGLQTAQNLPFKTTTEVTTNVMVKDGHTIVIGGLFRESANSTRSQIPVLGNLPFAGPLFRQQADTTKRDELIILLTPHIVKDDIAYSELSEQQMKDAERLRVGVRKGMMIWGRERLAEMNYEIASEEMNKRNPDRKRAIWHLDAATNLNPKFLEAIKLKQDLTGKELTDADNSSIRAFVSHAIMADRPPATQPSAVAEQQPDADEVVQAPASMSEQLAAAPTSAPSTQPVARVDDFATAAPATAPSTTQPVAQVMEESAMAIAEPATAPSTQPVASDDSDSVKATSVTELPMDELPAVGDAADLSK